MLKVGTRGFSTRLLFLLVLMLGGGVQEVCADSIPEQRVPILRKIGKGIAAVVKEFNNIDTAYVEPQHYNLTVMLQNTNTYEMYRLASKSGQSVTFAPRPSIKVGPYFGWRWLFLGYTFDLRHVAEDDNKREFNLSLYSSMVGVDLFYRKAGGSYRIKNINLGEDVDTSPMRNTPFSGINVGIKGFNLYYIFNHRKFSYPAAFSQSTCQRRSCGSFLAGIGYTRHLIKLDHMRLQGLITEKLENPAMELEDDFKFNKVKYKDYSLSGGYAYNYVFAHNWLLAGSLSLALCYKKTYGNIDDKGFSLREFSFNNVNLNAVGRFGIVWNNTRWYSGMSAIFHSYNYDKKQFRANSIFGNINVYVGYNFNRRK